MKRFLVAGVFCLVLLLASCYQYVYVPFPVGDDTGNDEVVDNFPSYDWISAGNGTVDNPYVLGTVGDILGLAELINNGTGLENTYYELLPGAVYDFSGVSDFKGIGNGTSAKSNGTFTDANPFTGVFDGNGATIRNLTLSYSGGEEDVAVGFFGTAYNSTITGINFENIRVESDSKASAIAVGCAINTNITSVTVTDSFITSPATTAGIVARYNVHDQNAEAVYSLSNNTVEGTTIVATRAHTMLLELLAIST